MRLLGWLFGRTRAPATPVTSVDAPAPRNPPPRPALHGARWFDGLPERLLAIDVETTGLHSRDRVVSLGAVLLRREAADAGAIAFDASYWVFDPGKRSHPQAERVHGWDDWTLRHQDKFADHASAIQNLITKADLLVAHNMAFDKAFVEREFDIAGIRFIMPKTACTLEACRARDFPRCSLDYACSELGLARRSAKHASLEDAWLSLNVYLRLHTGAPVLALPDAFRLAPQNLRAAPARPEGPLAPRARRRPAKAEPAPSPP